LPDSPPPNHGPARLTSAEPSIGGPTGTRAPQGAGASGQAKRDALAVAQGVEVSKRIFPGTASTYDDVVAWTTLGLDAKWKRALLAMLPESTSVLELACGTGILTGLLLERFPRARFVGVDLTADYLAVGRARHEGRGRDVSFVHGDATTAPLTGRGPFDLVVSCYLPKYVDPALLLDHLAPHLAPGAFLALQDFDRPRGTLPRFLWRRWFGFLNLYVPWRRPEWSACFDRSLLRLVETSHWPHRYGAALESRGWQDVRTVRHSYGAARTLVARRQSAGVSASSPSA